MGFAKLSADWCPSQKLKIGKEIGVVALTIKIVYACVLPSCEC